MLDNSTSQLIQRKYEDSTSQLIEQKQEIPEQPNYIKEKNISFYTATVFSTIIIFCALISLIVNIKRKSTIKILLSIVLPIIAVIISKKKKKTVLLNIRRNGMEASSMIFIIATLIVMTVIFLTLIIMIFKKTKK